METPAAGRRGGAADQAQTSGAAQVFRVPELFELILARLSALELLPLQRVSRSWRSLISASPTLQRATFYSPARGLDGALPAFFDSDFCGLRVDTLRDADTAALVKDGILLPSTLRHSLDEREGEGGPWRRARPWRPGLLAVPGSPPPLDARLLNPFLALVFRGLRVQHLEYGWTLFSFNDLPFSGPSNDSEACQTMMETVFQPSWANMLLTAAPLPRLRIEPAAQLRTAPGVGGMGWIAPPDPEEERRIAALYARMSLNLAVAHSNTSGPDRGGDLPLRARGGARNGEERAGAATRRRWVLGGAGEAGPAPLPPATALRWAAARGEASNEGWVWGSSLQFSAAMKRPQPTGCRSTARLLEAAEGSPGITLGQLEEVVRNTKWRTWVIRRVD